jgi:hypothetical protein
MEFVMLKSLYFTAALLALTVVSPALAANDMIECNDASMTKMKTDVMTMPDGDKKTMAMKEMKMAEDMMMKKDMKGCMTHMDNAMKGMAADASPDGTGVGQSTEGKGATDKDTSTMAPMGSKDGASTGKEPGTGVEDSVQGEGATNKQGMDDMKEGKGGTNMGGAASGNAPGGTGIEDSEAGKGSQNKN